MAEREEGRAKPAGTDIGDPVDCKCRTFGQKRLQLGRQNQRLAGHLPVVVIGNGGALYITDCDIFILQ